MSGPQGPYEPAVAAALWWRRNPSACPYSQRFWVEAPHPFITRERLLEALADALRRLKEIDWPLRQTTDHGTHLAIYITDPDGNDLELAWDRPFDQWPRYGAADAPAIDASFDLDELLAYRVSTA